jgi:hypothetical protein
MDRRTFSGLILLALGLTGLPLWRKSLRSQLACLLVLAAVLLVIGFFVPELAWSIGSGVFPVALVLVVIIWLIGHARRLGGRRASAAPGPSQVVATGDSSRANAARESSAGEPFGPEGEVPPGAPPSPAGDAAQEPEPGPGPSDEEGGRSDA